MKSNTKKMSLLTSRLMKQIALGGIVVAPRRAGKTTAIIELMIKDPSYVLVCPNNDLVTHIAFKLILIGIPNALQRVIGASSINTLRGRNNIKVIVDEAFFNPAFLKIPYHCAVSTAPKRMAVYNSKGKVLTVNKKGEDSWI